ncbi:CHASE3 domain-containing protein [Flavobacterium antarcticum]|uniref:sensor histidine kinase n=1 Tax=Flavobacterium antarcticum TaxID=271155 RepID=UPI0003B789F5|nr:CHASE3 domain-containing protein [Flavobacterium antarcticum]
MKFTLKNKIDITFFAVALVVIVLIITSYNRAEAVKQNRATIYQTSTANTLLEKILSTTIDIETSSRGFAITGSPEYLDAFIEKNSEINKWIDSLRSLKIDNSHEILKLDSIEDLILKKITFSDSTILRRKRDGMESAAKLIETGRGKEIMDSIKVIVAKYQEQQINILSNKLKQTEDTVQTRNMLFLAFVFIISLLIFIAYILIRKAVHKIAEQDEIQRNLIEELSVQNNQLNDFSSIISHNLRAPAANITMLIETYDENGGVEEAKTVFEMLKKVSQNLNETLNHLIDIMSLKATKKIEIDTVKFETVLNKTIENLQGEILHKDAVIKTDFSEAPIVNYPIIYLESIFHNLISNALKYAAPDRKPVLNISSQMIDGQIYLNVQDNGLGIDLNKYGSKLFGMNKVFHEHPDAKGIGLFMTKMQVERFGGKIVVKSEVNVGTIFTILFT